MATVIIALVSEQRMQNIIPVFQDGLGFARVYLVRSVDADQPGSKLGRALADTMEALRACGVAAENAEPSVDAYAVEAARRVVLELINRSSPPAPVVNFTGGTKCMSIGAFLAARDAGVAALYVDTANERLIWFHPDGTAREEPFVLGGRLGVEVYLRSYGRPVDGSRTRKHAMPTEAFDLADELLAWWPGCLPTLEKLGDAQSQGRPHVAASELDPEIVSLLASYGYVAAGSNVAITPRGRPVLNKGKWLEAMACALLRKSGYFDEVRANVCLRGVQNELDVVVARNGMVAVLECKGGLLGGTGTLDRLQAIRGTLGTFVRSFLVTSRAGGEVPADFRERAGLYGIRRIVTAEDFLQVADIVREGMRGGP